MNPALYYAQALGKDLMAVRDAADILNNAGNWSIARWDASVLGAQPSAEEFAAVVALPEPATQMPVPEVISNRQFFQQLAIDGDITEDEALAAVTTGTLPAKLTTAISSLPADQRFAAKMLCCGAKDFYRFNPIIAALGPALGKKAAALDAIWVAASAL